MADNIDTDNFKFVKDAEEREKLIWNNAIEAAELEISKKLKYPTEACAIVRGLKK